MTGIRRWPRSGRQPWTCPGELSALHYAPFRVDGGFDRTKRRNGFPSLGGAIFPPNLGGYFSRKSVNAPTLP